MSNFKVTDLKEVVEKFCKEGEHEHHRYKSFDFCYTHFSPLSEDRNDIEKGCYVLWSYLASWGMLRGSSFLLSKNPAYLQPLVEFICAQDFDIWQIDVNNYPQHYEKIQALYQQVKSKIIENNEKDLVLVTKILLGVFGVVPAYDQYFRQTFRALSRTQINQQYCGFTAVNETSLGQIYQFYLANRADIDELHKSYQASHFDNKSHGLNYTRAKIIDMYGFNKGLSKQS